MKAINKTMSILTAVEKAKICSIEKLADSEQLQGLFTSSKYPHRRIIDTINLISRQGYVSIGSLDNEKIVKITTKGRDKLTFHRLLQSTKSNAKSWNGHWYLLTFDIPDEYKSIRNRLIITLKQCGMINYSKGVWITPHDITPTIKKITNQLGISRYIRHITAIKIDQASLYKRKFNL